MRAAHVGHTLLLGDDRKRHARTHSLREIPLAYLAHGPIDQEDGLVKSPLPEHRDGMTFDVSRDVSLTWPALRKRPPLPSRESASM